MLVVAACIACMPAVVFWLLCRWFTRRERAWTDAYWDSCARAYRSRLRRPRWDGMFDNAWRIDPFTGETLHHHVMGGAR